MPLCRSQIDDALCGCALLQRGAGRLAIQCRVRTFQKGQHLPAVGRTQGGGHGRDDRKNERLELPAGKLVAPAQVRDANAAATFDPGVHGHAGGARQRGCFVGGDHVSRLNALQSVLRTKAQQRIGLRFRGIRVLCAGFVTGQIVGGREREGEGVHGEFLQMCTLMARCACSAFGR